MSMHAGTSLVGATTRSVMAKRVGSAGVTAECGICYSSMPARTETRPFQCNHSICTTCDRRMQGVDDNRCPTCRQPRQGMSAAEAEPPPDRNYLNAIHRRHPATGRVAGSHRLLASRPRNTLAQTLRAQEGMASHPVHAIGDKTPARGAVPTPEYGLRHTLSRKPSGRVGRTRARGGK